MNHQLLARNPALERAGWLPEGAWPELDALREEHQRLVREGAKLTAAGKALREGFETEDRERETALRTGYREGAEPDLPAATSKPEREAAIAAHEEREHAWREAFGEFLAGAIETIETNEESWQADLIAKAAEADRKREEAQRLLHEADAQVRDLNRLQRWLRRTSGRGGPLRGEHIPFADFPAKPPERQIDLAAIAGGGVVTHA